MIGTEGVTRITYWKPLELSHCEAASRRKVPIDSPVAGTWAQRLRELREDSTAWLGRSFTGQFSLAGAQAKTALLCQDGRWGVTSGSTPATHILKPAVAGYDDHDLNEHLCLDAARRAKLVAVRTKVTRFGDESAVVVDRYDRQIKGSEIVRVHQEDLCQALGVLPSGKYQNEGGLARPSWLAHGMTTFNQVSRGVRASRL
jgi:serine/threonine protein kinase HipA of HipAB toxin-antitoxin module